MDLLNEGFISKITGIIKEYDIPNELIRFEVTESAFSSYAEVISEKVKQLINLGFTVEIDDFGSGFSSLNTLKDITAQILKLDMRFFEDTENDQRSVNIVESVVRMAKWLGMTVIAEGVEEKAQADYLKGIGLLLYPGLSLFKTVSLKEYELLMEKSPLRKRNSASLEKTESLDNNEFWNPKSVETLIFHTYVGGACIFDITTGNCEVMRVNEKIY